MPDDAPELPAFDPDAATIPVAGPRPTLPRGEIELPLPEELTKLLPAGNYHVESFLGQGGMGAVYKGMQVRLKRPVAIKIMRRDQGQDFGFEQRFEREAQAMAKLNHPNIVSVIDYGEAGPDYLYIVMELVDGADLMDVIRGGQMTQEMALTLLPQICDALQFAHDHGIVHRDIKPSNIMVTRDGRVKMADFGLAKPMDAIESGFRTQTGAGMGTPDYAAPEQFDPSAHIDHRADIYALGVMIYQMITGQLPRGAWKRPSERAPVAPQWDEIVSRAMQSDPSDRYQQASEVKTDVSSIPLRKEGSGNERSAGTPARLNQSGGAAAKNHEAVRSDRAPAKSRAPLIFGLVVGAVVIALGAFFALRGGKSSSTAVASGKSQQPAPASTTPSTTKPTPPASPPPAKASGEGPKVSVAPAAATQDKPFTNTLGMKFVPVPGTQVLFSIWLTRVQDYAAFAKAQEAAGKKVDGAWKRPQKDGVPVAQEMDHPVVNVNWEEAQAFCAWLTEKDTAAGKLPKGAKYRLPTDAEWSTAVGLPPEPGTTPEEKHWKNDVDYPWGKEWPPTKKVGNYADESFHAKFPVKRKAQSNRDDNLWIEGYTDGYATTSPVGSFPANAYGLYDMGGNVWQWCEDWFNKSQTSRVLRGASWAHTGPTGPRSSSRHPREATLRDGVNGFRCVLEPAPSASVSPSPSLPVSSSSVATATKDAPFVNTLGMKFVPVPGTPVLFSIWHTRVQDYAAFAKAQEAAGKKVDGAWKTQQKDGVPAGHEADHPVVGVSWDDAQAFCQWLTAKETAEGKLPKGAKYRLPTDAEWSSAAGLPPEAGTTPEEKNGKNDVDFPWGKEFPPMSKVGNFADETFHATFPPKKNEQNGKVENEQWMKGYTDGYATTSPVFTFPANVHGLHDMAGNVWQWCEDLRHANRIDRVLRGSSWEEYSRGYLRSSYRSMSPPTSRRFFGFRCVLEPASSPAAVSQGASPAASAQFPPVNWVDVTADFRSKSKSKLKTEGDWSEPTADVWHRLPAPGSSKDLAVRVKFANRAELHFRKTGKGDSERFYRMGLGGNVSRALIARSENKQQIDLVRNSIDLATDNSEHEMIAAIRGDSLELWLDGTRVASAKDGMLKTGEVEFVMYTDNDAPFRTRKLEYAVLDPLPSPSAATATKAAPFTNTLGMKFVPVPGTPVLFSIWHTRVQDYAEFAKAQKAAGTEQHVGWRTSHKDGVTVAREADHPVVSVNWDDAQAFCQWLTAKETAEGKLTKGAKYRLPTDAEWSTAVGLPAETGATPEEKHEKNDAALPWGRAWPPPPNVGNYADESFHARFPSKRNEKENREENLWIAGYKDGYETTSPVGSFPANLHGLYDMGGNVWQWCEDWWNAEHKERVLRGASWDDRAQNSLRSSSRRRSPASSRLIALGFRCVLEPGPSTTAVSPAPNLPVSKSSTPTSIKLWDSAEKLPKKPGVSWENGALKISSGSVDQSTPTYRDSIARVSVQLNPDARRPEVWLRKHSATNSGYKIALDVPGRKVAANVATDGVDRRLAQWPLARVYAPNEWLKLEFRVIGDELTVLADGKVLGTLHDSTRSQPGGLMLYAEANGYFRDIEYVPLDAPAVSPAPNLPVSKSSVATATKTAPFTNTLGMKFVPVPGTPVLFSIWHTRVQDYAEFAKAQEAAGKTVDGSWKTQQKDSVPVGREPDHPVVSVRWDEAQAFCAWLTEKEIATGKLPKGAKYRLPTDAEWSTAVGLPTEQGAMPEEKDGKNDVDFPWGKEWPPTSKVGNFADESFHATFPPKKNERNGKMENEQWMKGYTDGYTTTSPVAAFPANAYGLYDMGGNAWQWCEDWWNAEHQDRVLRGASWLNFDRNHLQSSFRGHSPFGSRFSNNGFRCVLEPEPSSGAAATGATAPPSSAAEPWVNLLTQPERLNLPKSAVRTEEGLRITEGGSALVQKAGGDGGLRIRTNRGGMRPFLRARVSERGYYALSIRDEKTVNLSRFDAQGRSTTLRDFTLSAPIPPEQDYTLELRVTGSTLTAVLNGTTLGSVSDATHPTGGFVLGFPSAGPPIVIKSLELLALQPAVSPPPSAATKEKPFVNSLGMKFVPKSPGSQVLFSIWETRRSDYAFFAKAKKVDDSWMKMQKDGVPVSDSGSQPVVGVNWGEAMAFCAWLNEKEVAEGRLPPGIRYRLPTDAEWSSAAGLDQEDGATPAEKDGKDTTRYPWGTEWPPRTKVGNYADENFHHKFPAKGGENRWIAGYDDGFSTPGPVGSFTPNDAGIYDLGGNVWEWCLDHYQIKPTHAISRGASWTVAERDQLLTSRRRHENPDTRSVNVGFRVVLAPSGGGQAASQPSAAAEPWVNLLTQPERLALQKTVTLTSEGLTFADSGSAYAKDSGPDGGIRIRATFSANRPNLRARQTGSGNYSLALRDEKTLSLSSYEVPQQRSTPLRDFTLSAPIPQGQDYSLELRASGSTLTVVFNGATLGSVSDGTHAKGDFNVVANRGLVIKGYELLLPQPAVSPSPSDAAPDAWLDVLRDPERLILSKTIERTAEGLRFTDSGSAFVKDSGPDGGIRLRTSLGGLWTSLRARQADHGYYALAVHEQKTVRFTRFDSQMGRSTTLRDFNLSAPLQPGQEYSLELRADGPTFTAVLNGVTLGSVTDGAYTSGAFCVGAPAGGGPPAVIRSLELLALKPTTSPSPGTQGSKAPGAATKDAPFVNTLGMKFVPVPGTPVLFSIWPTRVQDYAEFAKAQEAAGKKVDGVWKNQEKDGVPVGHEADHPVVGLSWDDAQDFCQWLTMRDQSLGRLPQGMHYRLPKDEEWSWAVGLPEEMGETPDGKIAKNPVDFPWGKDWPPKGKVGNYADESFHATFPVKRNEKENRDENLWLEGYTDGYATTSPVGAFPANAYGLHDMGGNVWQWCEDWSNKSQTSRVLRGAPWSHHDRSNLQSSIRNRSTPTHRGRYVGFRVVLELAPSTTAVSPSPSPQGSASPSTATKDAPFVNSLGMKFVPVPITGGPTDGKGVLFSIWETRVQDYEAFVKEAKREWPNPDFKQEATHPAVMVNWDDAVAFCSWLTDKEQKAGKLPQDQIYRLPSDHEWSCAVGLGARGYLPIRESSNQGGQTFLWGAAWPPPVGSGNFKGQEAVTSSVRIPGWRDDFVKTSPVGFYPATAQGLHDLAGNAWEWVADPAHDSASTRFARGGSMAGGEPEWIRLEKRNRMFKERRGDDVGFRIVLVPVAN